MRTEYLAYSPLCTRAAAAAGNYATAAAAAAAAKRDQMGCEGEGDGAKGEERVALVVVAATGGSKDRRGLPFTNIASTPRSHYGGRSRHSFSNCMRGVE